MGWALRGLVVFVAMLLPGVAAACGPDTDCRLGKRTYRIALPEGGGPFGAIVFMHGYRGTAAGVMRNASFRAMAQDLGVALVAPKSGGEDWLIRNAPHRELPDDAIALAYFDRLLDDIVGRFDIDPQRILAAGFSAGGMMTWTLACHRPDRFAGFLPVSGTFWAPIPKACDGPPVDLVHIHGTSDRVVPLEGRPIGDTRQGDVRAVFAMYAREGGYEPAAPALDPPERLACEERANASGRQLDLCLHGGGHSVRAEWLRFGYTTLVEDK